MSKKTPTVAHKALVEKVVGKRPLAEAIFRGRYPEMHRKELLKKERQKLAVSKATVTAKPSPEKEQVSRVELASKQVKLTTEKPLPALKPPKNWFIIIAIVVVIIILALVLR